MARLLEDPDRFWAESGNRSPLVEPWDDDHVLVTFLWRGEAESTKAWWNIDVPLDRIPGTDVWHGSQVFPRDLRTTYCLTHDEAAGAPPARTYQGPSHLDPGNDRVIAFPADPYDPSDSDGYLSLLELPDAPADAWYTPRPGVTAGTLTTERLPGDELPITVYRPDGADPAGLPTLVAFDGWLAQAVMHMPTALDNLIAAGRVPPMTALFVHAREESRDDDLMPGPRIQSLIADRLLPWARDRWRIGSPTGGNVVAGMSRGGLVAAYIGLCRPDLFSGVIAHSGSFWWPAPGDGEPRQLIRDVPGLPRADVRIFLDVGRMETMAGPGGSPSQLSVCREMRDALRARGYAVSYTEFSGGHDYVNWRHTFPDALMAVTHG
ncbi:alpha/beta hydrolase-fold protein [Actinoplanes sp. NBRC 103695]|uniref:alpha/beta hydrolase n=1 Tax=Actinoplanes sp. NBRC 103695 TaxID=3032202 RepID=UPI002554C482|nr:alpha/beta hydrolase-fold protein [Actinoplanes sp. NBRC 103695]